MTVHSMHCILNFAGCMGLDLSSSVDAGAISAGFIVTRPAFIGFFVGCVCGLWLWQLCSHQ